MLPLAEGAEWLMGHNFLEHDLPYLKKAAPDQAWLSLPVIDTLKLSPLAFPQNPYHRLIKNYKIISSELNSPVGGLPRLLAAFSRPVCRIRQNQNRKAR